MSNHEIYADVLENGQLSKEKLYELMEPYSERADEIAENLLKEGKLKGDELADEFFNTLDGEIILRFRTEEESIELSLWGYRYDPQNEDEEQEFGACYLIEFRNLNEELHYADSFEWGEEERLIQKLQKLGFKA